MGINYNALDKKKRITMAEAGELYVPGGWKFTSCRCKKDCSQSTSCKCRKLGKPCNSHCHGGRSKNIFCQNCPPMEGNQENIVPEQGCNDAPNDNVTTMGGL